MSYQYNLGIRFSNIARKHKLRTALKYPDGKCIDYNYLDETSNQLGKYLINRNFRKGDVIAIFNEKSSTAYSLMLACLKTGIIYTNLDISSPWARLEKIINSCRPSAVFFDKKE